MKKRIFLLLLVCCTSLTVVAQNQSDAKSKTTRGMAMKAPKTSVVSLQDNTYSKLQEYENAHPITETNKRIVYIRKMERARNFYLQNGDAATAAKVASDIEAFKNKVRETCPACWLGEGQKPIGY